MRTRVAGLLAALAVLLLETAERIDPLDLPTTPPRPAELAAFWRAIADAQDTTARGHG